MPAEPAGPARALLHLPNPFGATLQSSGIARKPPPPPSKEPWICPWNPWRLRGLPALCRQACDCSSLFPRSDGLHFHSRVSALPAILADVNTTPASFAEMLLSLSFWIPLLLICTISNIQKGTTENTEQTFVCPLPSLRNKTSHVAEDPWIKPLSRPRPRPHPGEQHPEFGVDHSHVTFYTFTAHVPTVSFGVSSFHSTICHALFSTLCLWDSSVSTPIVPAAHSPCCSDRSHFLSIAWW